MSMNNRNDKINGHEKLMAHELCHGKKGSCPLITTMKKYLKFKWPTIKIIYAHKIRILMAIFDSHGEVMAY